MDALGEAVAGELVVVVEEQQRLEGGHQPGLIGLGDDVLAVHDVLGAAAGNSQPEIPAPLGRASGLRGAGGRRRGAAAAAGGQATGEGNACSAREQLPT